MFNSTLINKPYNYENWNLLELREKILSQFQLTMIDVLKYYHTKRKLSLDYKSIEIIKAEEYLKIEKIVMDEIEEFKKEIIATYIKKEKELFNTFEVAFKKENLQTSFSCLDFYINRNDILPTIKTSTSFRNSIINLNLSLNNLASKYNHIFNSSDFLHKLNWRISKEFSTEICVVSFLEKTNSMPKTIDLSLVDNFDYVNRTITVGKYYKSCNIPISNDEFLFPNIFNNIFVNLEFNIEKKIDEKNAKELLNDAIYNYLNKELKIDDMIFSQQLEAMPITINIDTTSGKIYLIDGFKRLLYMNNKKMLNKEVAIKVFYDLDIQDIISLLYAANYWKMTLANNNILFHDRGYLFALSTIFSIKENDFNKESYYSLINCLQLYDNVQHNKNFATYTSSLLNNKNFFVANKFLISDIKNMVIVNNIFMNSKYSPLLTKSLLNHIIVLLGYARRNNKANLQKEINIKQLLDIIFYDKKMSKIFLKKGNLSSDTYVNNMFDKNKIDKFIFETIEKMIIL